MDRTKELKQKLRRLKKLEMKLRFGAIPHIEQQAPHLVWDDFFALGNPTRATQYPLSLLLVMDKETLRLVIEEYLAEVYFRVHGIRREARDMDAVLFEGLGLAPDADSTEIRKRYRELARQFHPDAGGSAEDFIRLKDAVDALLKGCH